jgi:hypothetical protein
MQKQRNRTQYQHIYYLRKVKSRVTKRNLSKLKATGNSKAAFKLLEFYEQSDHFKMTGCYGEPFAESKPLLVPARLKPVQSRVFGKEYQDFLALKRYLDKRRG